MKKLHISFMKDLLNTEFDGLYGDIIKLMEHEQVEDSNIKLAFDMVKPHMQKIRNIRRRSRHELSILNDELLLMRTDYLISLRLRVQSYMRWYTTEERVAAAYIYDVLKEFGKNHYLPTYSTQWILVKKLIMSLHEDEEFRKAFTLLGLNELMDNIIKISDNLVSNLNKRTKDEIKISNNRKGVREAAYNDMKSLVDAINFMLVINRNNPEKRDYIAELMLRIDGYFQGYRTPMKSRNTKRKNKKAIAAAVNELISIQKSQQKALPVGVALALGTVGNVELPLSTNNRMGTAGTKPAAESRVREAETNDAKPNIDNSSKDSSIINNGKKGGKNVINNKWNDANAG